MYMLSLDKSIGVWGRKRMREVVVRAVMESWG